MVLPCISSLTQLLSCIPFLQEGFSQLCWYIFPLEALQVNCQTYQHKNKWGIEVAVPKKQQACFWEALQHKNNSTATQYTAPDCTSSPYWCKTFSVLWNVYNWLDIICSATASSVTICSNAFCCTKQKYSCVFIPGPNEVGTAKLSD